MDIKIAEALAEQLRARWPDDVGQPVRASVDDWTVEVRGRDGSEWPWPTSPQMTVILRHSGGSVHQTQGGPASTAESWADFAAALVEMDEPRRIQEETMRQGWEELDQIAKLGKRYNDDRKRLDRSTERLKEAVQTTYAKAVLGGPVTRYQLAQQAGVPQTTIHRWLR